MPPYLLRMMMYLIGTEFVADDFLPSDFGGFMRPSYRSGVNKKRSSRHFRKSSMRTKAPNMKGPMRGGIRF